MLTQSQVPELFRSGIDSIASATDQFTDDDRARPVCGSWTPRQIATDVLGVVGWYHEWLDGAIAGPRQSEQSDPEFVNFSRTSGTTRRRDPPPHGQLSFRSMD